METTTALTNPTTRWLLIVLAIAAIVVITVSTTYMPATGWLKGSWGVPAYGGW